MQNRNTSKGTGKEQGKQQFTTAEYLRQLYEAAKADGRIHSTQSGKCRITIRVL